MSDSIPSYPWSEGDKLYASALNAAFANSESIGGAIIGATVATVVGNAISVPDGTNYIVVQDSVHPVNSLTVGSSPMPDGYNLWMAFPNGGTFAGQTVGPRGNLTLKVLSGAWTILSKFG